MLSLHEITMLPNTLLRHDFRQRKSIHLRNSGGQKMHCFHSFIGEGWVGEIQGDKTHE